MKEKAAKSSENITQRINSSWKQIMDNGLLNTYKSISSKEQKTELRKKKDPKLQPILDYLNAVREFTSS